jgi:hypothetical protein
MRRRRRIITLLGGAAWPFAADGLNQEAEGGGN